MTAQAIAAIAAVSANGVIGADNRLPWYVPEDLARFKRLTMGATMILGRKTYDSLDGPLPGRRLIVVTRQPGYAPEGVVVAHSVDEALEKAREIAGEAQIWIAGGAEIYRQTLDRTDRIYLTRIEADFPGDTFFPEIDPEKWRLVEEERREPGERTPYGYRFELWERAS